MIRGRPLIAGFIEENTHDPFYHTTIPFKGQGRGLPPPVGGRGFTPAQIIYGQL